MHACMRGRLTEESSSCTRRVHSLRRALLLEEHGTAHTVAPHVKLELLRADDATDHHPCVHADTRSDRHAPLGRHATHLGEGEGKDQSEGEVDGER